MEAIHGRQSLLHNFLSGGTLGYLGVALGHAGVPFVNSMTFYRYPFLSPPMVGGAVYGTMAGAMAAFSGKQL